MKKFPSMVAVSLLAIQALTPLCAFAQEKNGQTTHSEPKHTVVHESSTESTSTTDDSSSGSSSSSNTSTTSTTSSSSSSTSETSSTSSSPSSTSETRSSSSSSTSTSETSTSSSSSSNSRTQPSTTTPSSSESTTPSSTTQSTSTQNEEKHPVAPAPEEPKEVPHVTMDSQTPTQDLTSFHFDANETTDKFVAKVGEAARKIGQKDNLYASVMIAQAILESGSGNSQLAQAPNYNLFGIKGEHEGKSVSFATQEDLGNGNMITIQSAFRTYKSYEDSFEDYAKLMKEGIVGNPHFYEGVWKSNAKTYHEATKFLTGKYATDTTYNKKLDGLIETYHLTEFDKPVNEATKVAADFVGTNGAVSDKLKVLEDVVGKQLNNGECYGLTAYYVAKLGGPQLMGSGHSFAQDIGTDYNWDAYGWQSISNPKLDQIQSGDVINWQAGGVLSPGIWGHTGVVVSVAKDGTLVTYEQNGGAGRVCVKYVRNYTMTPVKSVVRKIK